MRSFLKNKHIISLSVITTLIFLSPVGCKNDTESKKELKINGPIKLPDLPFKKDALKPHISDKTLKFHYKKHHRGYVIKTNKLIKDTKFENMTLTEIIKKSAKKQEYKDIFNNAAQVWNHTFYWNSIKPNGGKMPSDNLLKLIKKNYKDLDSFKNEFINTALSRFGSGWTWLVIKNNKLDIINTLNADNPLTMESVKPLICLDVWEHAYYLDYQNKRKKYAETFINNLVNWEFAEKQLLK